MSILNKMGQKNLLGTGFAVVETRDNRNAVLIFDRLPQDGETIDGWTFTDCRYTAIAVGGQVHASQDSTKTGDIYTIHKLDDGKYSFIRAGQHK